MPADPTPPPDPFARFAALFRQAAEALPDATPMTLTTATADGRPSARMVLLKEMDARGFVFYTNFGSRKAQELAQNPHAALVFWWPPLEVQVRVEGVVERVSHAEADAYFASRPRGSQLGAWASRQSQPLQSREALASRVAELEAEYAGREVPRPPHWGGYRVLPEAVEFWFGRPSRLHERERYQRDDTRPGRWRVEQLYP